jgi:hypothetical protein
MGFPNSVSKADPADTDNPSAGAAQIRNLKIFLEDLLGIQDAVSYSAAPFAIGTAGQVTVSQPRMLFQNGNATIPSFGFAGATGTGLAYDGATTAIAILRNGSKVGHLGIPQQPDMGGTGQDSSAWTGVVRTDAGVWSAADVLHLPGITDRLVTIGDDAGLSINHTAHSLMTLGRTLTGSTDQAVLCVSGVVTTGTRDQSAIYSVIFNSKDSALSEPVMAGNFEGVKEGTRTDTGTTYGLEVYIHHKSTGDDGPLIGLASEIYNRGVVGTPDVNGKINLALTNHQNQVTAGILFTDPHNVAIYGWETGILMRDCGYAFINMLSPTGYPFGTPASTTGILMDNHANWKSAIKLPNNVWIHSAYSVGGGDAPVIKYNSDDATISLGVIRNGAAVPSNFSATHYIRFKDQNGLECYIPCMPTTSW